jgi:hypothetical protein
MSGSIMLNPNADPPNAEKLTFFSQNRLAMRLLTETASETLVIPNRSFLFVELMILDPFSGNTFVQLPYLSYPTNLILTFY